MKTLKKTALLASANELAPPPTAVPVAHERLLNNLLGEVGKVDFYVLAQAEYPAEKLDPNEKLKQRDKLVLVVNHLLQLARRNGWGLCRREGTTYTYNGAYWRPLEKEAVERFLSDAGQKMGLKPLEAQSYQVGEQLYKQFEKSGWQPTPEPKRTATLVNLQNGTFEITPETQTLRPFHAADFLTYQLPFAYDAGATAPGWEAFLREVLPDESSRLVLAEYLGYVFIQDPARKLEKVLFLHGSGANGKSVVFEVVRALLGPQNVGNSSLQDLTTKETYRVKLGEVLVNYGSELSGGQLKSDTFKLLASGEPIEARRLYGGPFTLHHYGKLIFNCNELPADAEHSEAYFRRLLIIPFTETIPADKRDPRLAARIIAHELPGVFNWVLTGLQRLLKQRTFSECLAAEKQRQEYERQSNTALLFLDEYGYTSHATHCRPVADVYREYIEFCRESGHRYPVNRKTFVARLEAHGMKQHRTSEARGLRISKGRHEV